MATLEFYKSHYTDLLQPLLSLMRHGVQVDVERAKEMRVGLLARCKIIQHELAVINGAFDCTCGHPLSAHYKLPAPLALTKTGKPKKRQPPPSWPCEGSIQALPILVRMDNFIPDLLDFCDCKCTTFYPLGRTLHAKTDLSSARIVTFLYEKFAFPKQRKRGEESPTGDEVAVRRLIIKAKKWLNEAHTRVPRDAALWKRDPQLAIHACQLILEHREKFKTAGFLDETKLDEDGRLRCQYRFTTETGRLSSKSNPYGTGTNLQNIHRAVRTCFVPDDGCIFLEGDLSQAEKRIVDVLTGDPALIANAQSKPWEFDAHTHNAAIIFNVPVATVTKEQRYMGKRAVHASNYGMHGKRLSEALLMDDIVRLPDECQGMIDAYLNACPAIRTWQRDVRKTIMRRGRLVNSWGRELNFAGERMHDDTYRRGYAFVPQSEIGDLLNQWGLVPMWRWLRTNRMRSRINLQCHDALLISCPPDEAYTVAWYMRETLERPRVYNGVELSIPVEFALGRTWAKEREFKQLPDRTEFEATIQELLDRKEAA